MRSGICFPSHATSAAWTVTGGAADADFPATNLANLEEIRKVFLASAAGARNIAFTLPSVQSIDFIAFIHHVATYDSTFRIRLSAGTDGTVDTIYDSGAQPFWPAGVYNGEYPAVRPVVLPAPVNARSGYIELSSTSVPWEIGAVEIGRFWEWNVEFDREIGFDSRSAISTSGGLDHVTRQWSPRTVTGNRELVGQVEVDTTFLDFQRTNGLHRPFVWSWDVDDYTTWPRQTMLVTNSALPGGRAQDYDAGRMSFAFREHLR